MTASKPTTSNLTLSQAHAFRLTRVLNNDPLTRTIFLLGTLPAVSTGTDDDESTSRQDAIVKMEKTAFDTVSSSSRNDDQDNGGEDVGEMLMGRLDKIDVTGGNDIYHWVTGWFGPSRGADVKLMVIFPATETHIRKYTKQRTHMIYETPALYTAIHAPYIASLPLSRTQWVTNILDGISEQDAVVYRTPLGERESVGGGFVMIPDAKWDRSTLSDLYITLISHTPIQSLRSLTTTHLPLLRSMRATGEAEILAKYPEIKRGQLRFFVHYLPSYYHFHVHVTHIGYSNPHGMSVGQAHLLDDIISLIETLPNIYQTRPLSYVLGEEHALWPQLSAAGAVVDYTRTS